MAQPKSVTNEQKVDGMVIRKILVSVMRIVRESSNLGVI